MPRRTPMIFAVPPAFALLVSALISSPVPAASPKKLFPDFAGQKAGLGTVALAADVVVVEDVSGKVEKVYRDDCLKLGEVVLETIASGMREKGYVIEKKPLLSVGEFVDAEKSYRLLSTWEQHKLDKDELDAQGIPIVKPPFFVDSTLFVDSASRDALNSTLYGVWTYEKEKNEPAPPIVDAAKLRDEIGRDYAFFVLVAGTKVPFGKKFGQSMLSQATKSSGGSGNVTFSVGMNFNDFEGTVIKVAMVDLRDGSVLWSDDEVKESNIKEDNVEKFTKGILKEMP